MTYKLEKLFMVNIIFQYHSSGMDKNEEVPLSFRKKCISSKDLSNLSKCIINRSERSNLKGWEDLCPFVANPLNSLGTSFNVVSMKL